MEMATQGKRRSGYKQNQSFLYFMLFGTNSSFLRATNPAESTFPDVESTLCKIAFQVLCSKNNQENNAAYITYLSEASII